MKEIKTILYEVDFPVAFDEDVNAALASGWSLVRRGVVAPHQQDRAPFLCAELEREVVDATVDPCCGNCKHTDSGLSAEPCCSCEDVNGFPDHWEEGVL